MTSYIIEYGTMVNSNGTGSLASTCFGETHANNRFPWLSAHKRPRDKANVMATTSQHGEESKEKSGALMLFIAIMIFVEQYK